MTGLPSPRGRRRLGAALFSVAAAAALLLTPSGPAGAAPAGQPAAGPDAATCESIGYQTLGSRGRYPVLSDPAGEEVLGYIQVYYSVSKGRNCLQVHSDVYAQRIVASIKLSGTSTWTTDPPAAGQGPYHWYAGPVQSGPSAHRCIDIRGYVYQSAQYYGTETYYNRHCS